MAAKEARAHSDDLPVTEPLVRDLLAVQAPQWADLPMCRVRSSGTDSALFRLGDELVLRIPRRAGAAALLAKELDWLPRLADLPLRVPVLRQRGRTHLGIDCEFGIFDWIEGDIATFENLANPVDAAVSLAGFLKALHAVPVEGAPIAGPNNSHRGVPLAEMTARTLAAIDIVADEVDVSAAVVLWRSAVSESHSSERAPPAWLHGDLKADNLVAANGKLAGVIDWGLAAVGDPAADYAVTWSWVAAAARAAFKRALELDDGVWLRAKAWALYGAAIALSYYRGGKNEPLCRQSRLTLSQLGLLR